ncbi:MAG: SIS domain-containing protein [Alphaproteobacteria bacterium]|nr:SIS domain-containing protein [Alphaproteobacteria bacterium]
MASFDIDAFYAAEFAEHAAVVAATRDSLAGAFATLVRASAGALRSGNKLLFFGNGGSAADAQHLATELTVRYKADRVPIPALALTTDSSALTAIGNDLGFDALFARQVQALGVAGDVAIGISTSGRSRNVIAGLQAARDRDLVAAGLAGGDGGQMTGLADPLLLVPSENTARIQEMHITLGQMLCGALEIELGLA